MQRVAPYRTYVWGAQDRLVRVEKDDRTGAGGDLKVEYKYCQTCGGAMSERIEYASDGQTIVSWLRYEYDGLNLLRIDERYDGETPAGLDENDPWRPLDVFIHGPGAIGQIVKCKWYNYDSDGQNPTSCCDSGEYDYFYDALGNVNGVLDSGGHYYRWEMDAFGNDLPGGNAFLAMDQPGPKEHLTGKMFDTATGLYYFQARWYDPQVGRFVSADPARSPGRSRYSMAKANPTYLVDPSGAIPLVPWGSEAKCSLKDRVTEWLRILWRANLAAFENRFHDAGCGGRAEYQAGELKELALCCHGVATVSKIGQTFPFTHSFTVVKACVRGGSQTSWYYYGNRVLDDWPMPPLRHHSMGSYNMLWPFKSGEPAVFVSCRN